MSQLPAIARPSDQQTLATLFDLGRQVTSVLDLDALLHRIPELISRIVQFEAFAIFLLDERKGELGIAYSVGYPEGAAEALRLAVGQGLVGLAVAERTPQISNDLTHDPHYVTVVPNMASTLVVPLLFKSRPIGALNLLSATSGSTTRATWRSSTSSASTWPWPSRTRGSSSANAETPTRSRRWRRSGATCRPSSTSTRCSSESVTSRERSSTTARSASCMLNDDGELEVRLGLRFGSRVDNLPRVRLGDGIVGYATLHRVPVNVPDVSKDPRYIQVVEDVKSELAVPLLLKDRCIGVIDLESPQLGAFQKRDVEILTVLASQAAVALENARLYETVKQNEARLDKEVRFAQRVQSALLPTELPKRMRGVDVAARFSPAHELGGDFYDFLSPEAHSLVVALGDVSGKGVPAALYSAFASELVRSRTFRRRFAPEQASPGERAGVDQHHPPPAPARGVLLHAVLRQFRSQAPGRRSSPTRGFRTRSGRGRTGAGQSRCLVFRSGPFDGTVYEEVSFPLEPGEVIVFCSDGILEAADEHGDEFGTARLVETVHAVRHLPARAIIDAIYEAAEAYRADEPQADDMTAVVVKITV